MRRSVTAALVLAALLPAMAPSAFAASVPASLTRPANVVAAVQERQYRSAGLHAYNGPFGFYGNVWRQPPNEQSYLRNLGSRWNQETPPSLKYPKPRSNNSDW